MRPEEALGTWPLWFPKLSRRPRLLKKVSGGLTNSSWLVATENGDAILRINTSLTDSYGIDRQREALILETLSTEAYVPDILFQDLERGVLVTQYCAGEVYSSSSFPSQNHTQLCSVVARYQSVELHLPRFDYFHHLTNYREQAKAEDCFLPEWESDWLAFVDDLRVFQNGPWEPVLTHHDLGGDNLIFDGEELKIIDWEYAANGHPAFDFVSAGLRPNGGVAHDEIRFIQRMQWWMGQLWFALRRSNVGL